MLCLVTSSTGRCHCAQLYWHAIPNVLCRLLVGVEKLAEWGSVFAKRRPVKRLFSQFSDSRSFRHAWISQVMIVGLVRVHRSYLHKRTFESNVTYREMCASRGPSYTETICSSRCKPISIASLQWLKCWAFSQQGLSLLLCFHIVFRAIKWYVGWNKQPSRPC